MTDEYFLKDDLDNTDEKISYAIEKVRKELISQFTKDLKYIDELSEEIHVFQRLQEIIDKYDEVKK